MRPDDHIGHSPVAGAARQDRDARHEPADPGSWGPDRAAVWRNHKGATSVAHSVDEDKPNGVSGATGAEPDTTAPSRPGHAKDFQEPVLFRVMGLNPKRLLSESGGDDLGGKARHMMDFSMNTEPLTVTQPVTLELIDPTGAVTPIEAELHYDPA